ncbi:MAG: hypothetical protein DLM66_13715 [Candidatus Dormiibacter spiritus]|nr:MAG: hypothetical protein DLM66_13715 [Candidatus Dormibacteraeota bacterium]
MHSAKPTPTPTPKLPTAAEVVAKLQAAGLPMTAVTEVTEDTDPNHLLGRPHGYTSKTEWRDLRVPGSGSGGTDAGGSVEAFANADDAQARAVYVGGIVKENPLFGSYNYLSRSGAFFLRVSRILKPSEADTYASALKATYTDLGPAP